MANATAGSKKRPLDDLAVVGAVVLATASSIPAEYESQETVDVVFPEINPTSSSATVGLEGFEQHYRVVHFTASAPEFTDVRKPSQVPSYGWKDDAYELIKGLTAFSDGWDGPDSLAASKEAVRVARAMIREWPSDLPHPEVDLLLDGSLVLEIFDDHGFALASIETKSDGSVAYVVANGTEILASKREVDSSRKGITRVLRNIRDNVA